MVYDCGFMAEGCNIHIGDKIMIVVIGIIAVIQLITWWVKLLKSCRKNKG